MAIKTAIVLESPNEILEKYCHMSHIRIFQNKINIVQ